MSQTFLFGITRTKLSKKNIALARRIAKTHGATLQGGCVIPGLGWQAWFSATDYGEPFNRNLRATVLKALQDAGIPWVCINP